MKDQELFEAACAARAQAYIPYSHFAVGAAVRLADGRIITGANMENSSYGLTICAERCCVFRARMEGARKEDFKAMVIVGDTDRPTSPCGACRQVLSEFLNAETEITCANLAGQAKSYRIADLLPDMFTPEDLLK